jgi:hypothetical protein
MKYKIRELSARGMIQFAKEQNGHPVFRLSEAATKQSVSLSVPAYQEDCALFYQIMCVLGKDDVPVMDVCDALADVLVYVDFSGIFDRTAAEPQRLAKVMLTEGVHLDFGMGSDKYVAFERSANMSRQSKISFIREDLYAPVKRRIMLDMEIGQCQLSKLYAYNGLMLTNGFRVDDLSIWDSKRIVIVDNPVTKVYEAPIITVEDDGSDSAVRKYHRVETTADLEVTEFDGEGLISKEYATFIDKLYCQEKLHTSFQIRMPYIKGVVHEVDLKGLFAELDVLYIVDIWGERHDIHDVDLILTKSMFKGFGWMTENGLSFTEYLARCKAYRHALYISSVNQVGQELVTQFNYQFLHTVDMTAEEFRPSDLPLGWTENPQNDPRHWLTKYTELQYYRLTADENGRLQHYLRQNGGSRNRLVAELLQRNPLFLHEPVFTKELDDLAESIRKDYALGRLLISGDVRYLSGDLVRFVQMLVKDVADQDERFSGAVMRLEYECERGAVAYLPQSAYNGQETLTLLRNPHIARNEEAVIKPMTNTGPLRQRYFSHLSYVVMVDSRTLIPERLGGADFDGDLVKVIADPLLNACVARNYTDKGYDPFGYQNGIPLLKIPSATPQMQEANDPEACYDVIKNTFSSRVGQICNAAFNRSVIAYDENTDAEEKRALQEDTELLEILTGLEIDSVKSGVKPDLSDYIGNSTVSRSPFLKYKSIVKDNSRRVGNAPTQKQKLDAFFDSVDWESVTANIERLPYLAKQLKAQTPKLKTIPAEDSELFTFAKKKNWKDKLSADDLVFMQALIADYTEALARIRRSRHLPPPKDGRRRDINRILFARGQDADFTADELYAVFADLNEQEIEHRIQAMQGENWHLMNVNERLAFLRWVLPVGTPQQITDLFTDFRQHGYRLLIDVLFDLQDTFRTAAKQETILHHADDSETLRHFMKTYEDTGKPDGYKDLIAASCRRHIHFDMEEETALKCAVALGQRSFVFDVLLDLLPQFAVKRRRKG